MSLSFNLFTLSKDIPSNVNFIYMFNNTCENQLNIFSSKMNKGSPNLDEFLNSNANKFTAVLKDPQKKDDEQEEFDFKFINLNDLEGNVGKKRKTKLMNKCSLNRFRRADVDKWILEERVDKNSTKWIRVDLPYDEMKIRIQKIKNELEKPTLVQNQDDDFVIIAIGGVSGKKTKKIRKHRGINQTGGNKGKLKKGYRFSGKKLKNGLPKIVKSKKQ